MDRKQLRQHARAARDQISRERAQLVEQVLDQQTRQAEDKVRERIVRSQEEIDQHAQRAALRGQDETILLRLSSQLYDLRLAVTAELNASSKRDPDPYPQLRKLGPASFQEVDRWLKDLSLEDPHQTSPLAWLDELAHWLHARPDASLLKRLLRRRPPMPPALSELYDHCRRERLNPRFEFYDQLDDRGIALRVSW